MEPTVLQGWRGKCQSKNIAELISTSLISGFYKVFFNE